jgi:hypothetical protein
MTKIERAIESAQSRLDTTISKLERSSGSHFSTEKKLRQIEVAEITLEALHEKAERERGCGYCNNERHCIREAFDEGTAQIIDAEKHYALSIDTSRDAAIFNIFCCPMCGRRLEVRQDDKIY